jgi:hypothetical protein
MFASPRKSEEQACTLGHHLRLLKAKTERITVLEQNQDKQQQVRILQPTRFHFVIAQ